MPQKQSKRSKPKLSEEPVRRLIKESFFRTTGSIFVEGITPYAAEFESYNERYAIQTLLLCNDILELKTQPFKINYLGLDGKEHTYTPDIWVRTFLGDKTIEIKGLNFLFLEKSIEYYIPIAQHLQKESKAFVFLTDNQLTSSERFKNVKILIRYVNSNLPQSTLEKLSNWQSSEVISIEQLMELLGLQLVEVYTAIAQRHLSIEWNFPLSINSLVSIMNKPFKGLSIDDILSSGGYGSLLEQLAMGIAPADKQLLAIGANWRQPSVEYLAFGAIGGFQKQKSLRDPKPDEYRVEKLWDRRYRAPGSSNQTKYLPKSKDDK
jgi:hypothetical protein